jgi:predicted dinucleotide-binding enzyme
VRGIIDSGLVARRRPPRKIVVVAVPFRAYPSVPAGPPVGKIVLDTSAITRNGAAILAAPDDGPETSS